MNPKPHWGRSRLYTVWLVALFGLTLIWFLISPPRWWLNLIKPVDLSNPEQIGETIIEKYDCRRCHQINRRGKYLGPNLDSVTERIEEDTLRNWLRNPKAIKKDTPMPNFHLSEREIDAIIAYLQSL